jgi:elongator complex protein 3
LQNPTFSQACSEISETLLSIKAPTKNQVKAQIKKICTKYSLERIPRNYEILATVNGDRYMHLKRILIKKPIKTASGVAVIALMPMPYACPHGRCTYCPGGVEFNSPNSYTGNEPSTINAIENEYDAKKQILTKIEKHMDMTPQRWSLS